MQVWHDTDHSCSLIILTLLVYDLDDPFEIAQSMTIGTQEVWLIEAYKFVASVALNSSSWKRLLTYQKVDDHFL